MSNYPPGVTGNEYEISGPDNEWYDEDWICNNVIQRISIPLNVFKTIQDFITSYKDESKCKDMSENLTIYLSRLHYEINPYIEENAIITSFTCNNIGAEKQSYRGEIWWQCDQCGEQYQDWVDDRD